MPSLSHINYDKLPPNKDSWTVYADTVPAVKWPFTQDKNYYYCDFFNILVQDHRIHSVFEKCNLEGAYFTNCYFEPSSMFIDCCLYKAVFTQCKFALEEQLIFLKMNNAVLYECRVEGNDEYQQWNVRSLDNSKHSGEGL